jgi:hypothetical protein
MSCAEADRLRHRAHELHLHLLDQRQKARAKASLERGNQVPGRSDYEAFLRRKLTALAGDIERHLGLHNCEN